MPQSRSHTWTSPAPEGTRPADCGRAIAADGRVWTITDVRCHDNAYQCIGGGSAAIRFSDSECDHNGFGRTFTIDATKRSAACIKRASTGSGDLVVDHVFIHDNYWIGVWCDYCSRGPFIVENSTITDNVSQAVSWEVSGGWNGDDLAVVRNNVIQRNGLGESRTAGAGIVCIIESLGPDQATSVTTAFMRS